MSGTSAAGAAAAGGGGGTGVVGVNDINHSATQGDRLPLSSDVLAQLSKVKTQLAVLDSKFVKKMGISDTIDYLTAKGSVGERRLPMVEGAASEISGALVSLQKGLKRLNGAALLEGHSKNFAHVPRAAKKTTTETTDTLKKDIVADSTSGVPELSSVAVPPFLPGLSLPTDVLRDIFLPWLTPNDSTALCRTSDAVGSAVEAALVADIDSIIRRDGVTGVIGYSPLCQSTSVRRLVRRMRLIRLHYLMQLPIELTGDDLQHVGSKAVIDSRPPSMRQYALYSHRLGRYSMLLMRTADGTDTLGGSVLTVHSDAADPPCQYGFGEYGSFRGLTIMRLALLSSRLVSDRSYSPSSAGCDHICALMAQEPPLWDGCRTIDYHYNTIGPSYRLVILHGAEEGDDFAAYIRMAKWSDGSAHIDLWTSEAPQQGVSGPAAFPRAVAIAHEKISDTITVLPEVNETINTAGGVAST
ncbi:unnamed protein product [Vitrella brassicaformis CCMP3155]|uniref:Uncharacterized protein n=1 Tax=Vitrella brassicaformis (strain CCMP3155) TaxID=1169540 RepID=A0A0G4G085_VITBC|nr:unnamed protein product [Vitrella brassicaformis CCMP3155]|eukprot:CEM21260.1 unnamed protein product [Vitrella brassicaformis CCMP3155]